VKKVTIYYFNNFVEEYLAEKCGVSAVGYHIHCEKQEIIIHPVNVKKILIVEQE